MAKRQIITDRDITEAWKKGLTTITISDNTLITPQAKDSAKVKNIIFLKNDTGLDCQDLKPDMLNIRKIAIASDHSGFKMKEMIKKFLMEKKLGIIDLGTNSDQPCDYPDFAYASAIAIKQGQADIGIIIDGAGVASAIVANKVPGIRAISASDEFTARICREHVNSNILCLGSKVIGEELAKSIINAFISAKFQEGRHLKRVEKIRDIENKFLKG